VKNVSVSAENVKAEHVDSADESSSAKSDFVCLKDIPFNYALAVSIGGEVQHTRYNNISSTVAGFFGNLTKRKTVFDKEGVASFVPGTLLLDFNSLRHGKKRTDTTRKRFVITRNGRRIQENMATLSAIVFDVDHGGSIEETGRMLAAVGVCAMLVTSHSHGLGGEERYRVIVPFAVPFEFEADAEGNASADSRAKWTLLYERIARELPAMAARKGVQGAFPVDGVSDASRMFYLPSAPHRPHAEPQALLYGAHRVGDEIVADGLLDWRDFWNEEDDRSAKRMLREQRQSERLEKMVAAGTMTAEQADRAFTSREMPKVSFDGWDLRRWIAEHGRTFDIEGLIQMRLPDVIDGYRNGDGFRIRCPYGHEHANGDEGGAWAVNSDGDNNFTLACAHSTCKDGGRAGDRLELLKGWLESGAISKDDLEDEEIGGGRLYRSDGGDTEDEEDDALAAVLAKYGVCVE
jgi:hypothetical protein